MNLSDLRDLKGVPEGRTLLDFMGRQELAANLFRITQTEAKIGNEAIKGQRNLEKVAFSVGQTVRKTMIEISNTTPESLPITGDIVEVKGNLKKARREFGKIDKPGRKSLPAPKPEDSDGGYPD